MSLLMLGCADTPAELGPSPSIQNPDEEDLETNYCPIHYMDEFGNVYDVFTDPSCKPHICGNSNHGICSSNSDICQQRVGQECVFRSQQYKFNSRYIELEEQRKELTAICANIYSCNACSGPWVSGAESEDCDTDFYNNTYIDCSFFFDQIPRLTEVINSWALTQCYADTLLAWNYIASRAYDISELSCAYFTTNEEKDQAIRSIFELSFPRVSGTSFLSNYCSF